MVVSFIKKINGTISWIALEIFDNVVLMIDSIINVKKGSKKYNQEDIRQLKKENRRLIKEFICRKRAKTKSLRR